jgi:hypothetical protein
MRIELIKIISRHFASFGSSQLRLMLNFESSSFQLPISSIFYVLEINQNQHLDVSSNYRWRFLYSLMEVYVYWNRKDLQFYHLVNNNCLGKSYSNEYEHLTGWDRVSFHTCLVSRDRVLVVHQIKTNIIASIIKYAIDFKWRYTLTPIIQT